MDFHALFMLLQDHEVVLGCVDDAGGLGAAPGVDGVAAEPVGGRREARGQRQGGHGRGGG